MAGRITQARKMTARMNTLAIAARFLARRRQASAHSDVPFSISAGRGVVAEVLIGCGGAG